MDPRPDEIIRFLKQQNTLSSWFPFNMFITALPPSFNIDERELRRLLKNEIFIREKAKDGTESFSVSTHYIILLIMLEIEHRTRGELGRLPKPVIRFSNQEMRDNLIALESCGRRLSRKQLKAVKTLREALESISKWSSS
jgi:hypothetical protein